MCAQVFLSSSQVAQTPQQAQDAIDLFMREMDSDNDGHISYDEMKVGCIYMFMHTHTQTNTHTHTHTHTHSLTHTTQTHIL